MSQIPIEFTMHSPASQALRAAKKAAFTGVSEEERKRIDQQTANRFENLGQALRQLGCTGIIVAPNSVRYTRPAKSPYYEQFGDQVDWIKLAEQKIKENSY